MKKITYVTGNWAKIASAKKALEPLGFEIDNIKMETPEIQANDVSDVSKYSAKWAAEKLNQAVLKNDSGLKNCPFCGSKWTQTRYINHPFDEHHVYGGYRGECTDCGVTTKAYKTREEVLRRNTPSSFFDRFFSGAR